jgi:hypothetical protein
MTTPEAIRLLRDSAGWYVGDKRALEVLEAYRALALENDIYRADHLKAIEACMWMHDDKTLGIPLGGRLTSDGVTALRKQRDDLRAQLSDRDQTVAQLEGMLRQASEQLAVERDTNHILQQAAITAGENARAERAYSDERSALLVERSKECEALKAQLAAMTHARDDAIAAEWLRMVGDSFRAELKRQHDENPLNRNT